jgi:hypothetical protein
LPETEPNDSLAQAPNVQVGRTYTGTLAAGDVDMLRLGMGTPVALTLTSTGESEFFVTSPTDGVRRRYLLLPNLPLTLDAVARAVGRLTISNNQESGEAVMTSA